MFRPPKKIKAPPRCFLTRHLVGCSHNEGFSKLHQPALCCFFSTPCCFFTHLVRGDISKRAGPSEGNIKGVFQIEGNKAGVAQVFSGERGEGFFLRSHIQDRPTQTFVFLQRTNDGRLCTMIVGGQISFRFLDSHTIILCVPAGHTLFSFNQVFFPQLGVNI